MSNAVISIAARFCGPPNSANGGYAAGMLAQQLGECAEVTLRAPPPLDTDLEVLVMDDGSLQLLHQGLQIATAKKADPLPCSIAPVTLQAAEEASKRTFGSSGHPVPGCFVCGPAREPGDGLRLQVGPVAADDHNWSGVLASPWIPTADLADAGGEVCAEFIWSALDCPTAYACSSAEGMPLILLGRQTVQVLRRPRIGDQCVVVARRDGQEGRKHFASACLFSNSGELLATCKAVWISVSPEVLNKSA